MDDSASLPIESRPASIIIRGRQVILRPDSPEYWDGLLWVDQHLPYAVRFFGRTIRKLVIKLQKRRASDLWFADFEPTEDGYVRLRSPNDLDLFGRTFGDRFDPPLPIRRYLSTIRSMAHSEPRENSSQDGHGHAQD